MEHLWEDFWWNNITGPNAVVKNVSSALLDNKMVVLKVPSDLPWRHAMRSAIQCSFQEKSDLKDVIIEVIDMYDDNPEQLDPGRFILQKYATSTLQKGYRERSKVTIQEYIAVKKIINNRIIWIKGLNVGETEKWIEFCCGFSKRSAVDGTFVLEGYSDVHISASDIIEVVDFSRIVSSYDVQLFNSFVINSKSEYSDTWKRYISTCAALVCNQDAEISEYLIQSTDFKNESVIDGIMRTSKLDAFSRRGGELDSQHILRYCRQDDIGYLEHKLWSAQVQVLFPIIEIERVNFIKKYEDEIQQILDSEAIYQYQEILHCAIDVELGSLCFLMTAVSGRKKLSISNKHDRERIFFLHDCRNDLAHSTCCSCEKVVKLLESFDD